MPEASGAGEPVRQTPEIAVQPEQLRLVDINKQLMQAMDNEPLRRNLEERGPLEVIGEIGHDSSHQYSVQLFKGKKTERDKAEDRTKISVGVWTGGGTSFANTGENAVKTYALRNVDEVRAEVSKRLENEVKFDEPDPDFVDDQGRAIICEADGTLLWERKDLDRYFRPYIPADQITHRVEDRLNPPAEIPEGLPDLRTLRGSVAKLKDAENPALINGNHLVSHLEFYTALMDQTDGLSKFFEAQAQTSNPRRDLGDLKEQVEKAREGLIKWRTELMDKEFEKAKETALRRALSQYDPNKHADISQFIDQYEESLPDNNDPRRSKLNKVYVNDTWLPYYHFIEEQYPEDPRPKELRDQMQAVYEAGKQLTPENEGVTMDQIKGSLKTLEDSGLASYVTLRWGSEEEEKPKQEQLMIGSVGRVREAIGELEQLRGRELEARLSELKSKGTIPDFLADKIIAARAISDKSSGPVQRIRDLLGRFRGGNRS